MIRELNIKNFRGLEDIEKIECDTFNIFIGDNGTSKTTILEAINHAFSPSFLSGRIKHTDFINGTDEPIEIYLQFSTSIEAELPDGYITQKINCDKLYLRIKKRDKKKAGKVFSDAVTLEHILVPDFPREKRKDGWKIKRKNGSDFTFTTRSLGINQISTSELPRSFLFGKDRDRQLQKGFNSSFSTIIDDLNWRFSRTIRKETEEGQKHDWFIDTKAISDDAQSKVDMNKNEVFKELKKRTDRFGLDEVNLSIIDSLAPFDSSFLSASKQLLDLPIKNLGSGIEMIVSLLFLETLASLSKEKLLILIDEPELHLHPKLQVRLAEYLWDLSKGDNGHQVFVTTHSPIFYKNSIGRDGVKTFITKKENSEITVSEMSLSSGLFPWSPSWGEINFFAYDYLTIEFHDELYGYIQEKAKCYYEKDIDDYLENQGSVKNKSWTKEINGVKGITYDCTLPVFIRNKIHHPENGTMQGEDFTADELAESTEQMIEIVKALNKTNE
ncbi:MAG: AAA family ATPase [Candidatus Paceibacterota bacterium]